MNVNKGAASSPMDGTSSATVHSLENCLREARSAGDPTKAITTLSELTRLAPREWRFAVGLANELHSAGRGDEGDSLLCRAIMRFPEEFWVAYHWAYSARRNGRLDLAEGRSRRLLDRFADEHRCHELVGDIAIQSRDYASAAAHFEKALALKPDATECRDKLRVARLYQRMAQRVLEQWLAQSGSTTDYVPLVINLDRSTGRLGAITAAFSDCNVQLSRMPGVQGSYLPDVIARILTRSAQVGPKGTLGNFLSHAAAWERMLKEGHRWCLVLEDDAVPRVSLPPSVRDLQIPPDCDLCFVNQRMERRLSLGEQDQIQDFRVYSPMESVETFPAQFRAPGSDGYFVSEAGAKKLLAYVERDGFGSFVDWRLLAYSVGQQEVARLLAETPAAISLAQLHRSIVRGPERLKAYALYPALIETKGQTSVIGEENALG